MQGANLQLLHNELGHDSAQGLDAVPRANHGLPKTKWAKVKTAQMRASENYVIYSDSLAEIDR